MYYYTDRLTYKSDVFSFGVFSLSNCSPERNHPSTTLTVVTVLFHILSRYLVDILDPQVMEEGDGEVQEVAALGAMCTELNGEGRPTMREVEMALENLQAKMKPTTLHNLLSSGKYHGREIATRCVPLQGVVIGASRRYSMEEEILLSARYGR
jgi:hypothetical protein